MLGSFLFLYLSHRKLLPMAIEIKNIFVKNENFTKIAK